MTPTVERDCTIIGPNGQEFTAGGAIVTDEYIYAYLGRDPGGKLIIQTWHGEILGFATITRSWRAPEHWILTTRILQLYANIGGRWYTGRGYGVGLHCRLYPVKNPKRNPFTRYR